MWGKGKTSPAKARLPASGSAFHQNLTTEDREELLKLQTLRDIPKSKYATQSCVTGLPSGRGRKIVYSHIEVYKMVEEIATDLREAGVRPQTVCAFILHNSIEAVVYFQALQWIGAIAVPIDPDLSEQEITLVLKETKALTIVSALVDEDEQPGNELCQKIKAACSPLDVIEWYVARSTNRGVFLDRKDRRAGEGAAWSGGAGDFKYDPSETSVRLTTIDADKCLAVDVSHRSITNATREFSNTYKLTAEMSTLLVFPFHSIHGLLCVLASVFSGGNVAIQGGLAIEAKSILKLVSEYKINWFSADPDTILAVYDDISRDPSLLKDVNLSFIQSVDGTIEADTMKTIEPILRTPVLEAYGTPETCGMVSANREMDFRPGTCGQAVHGCDIVILDKSGQIVPAGTIGNIGAKGVHICQEYIDNEYANENCFVEVTDGEETQRYFLTGDQGSLSTDGYLKVTSAGRSRNRAGALAAQQEEEMKRSRNEIEAARVLKLAAEQKRLDEIKRKKEEEEEKLRQEQESKRLEEEQRLKEEREKEEARLRDAETTTRALESTNQDEDDSDEVADSSSQNVTGSVSLSGRSTRVDEDMFNMIMERLDAIERNQRRLEEDIEAGHRAEMERLRALMEKYEQQPTSPVANVDMDAINSAVNAAAASAQSSSRDTAAAAQAAKEAAEAAGAARAAALVETSPSVVEVSDPNAVQKTVLVSLDEVEQAMKMHPAVSRARAFGRPDKKYGMEVFCAVTPKPGARVSEPWLKLHAQTVLAAAFVPKKFFYKEDLKDHEERATLSTDMTLKRLSEYAGFKGASKVVKEPQWSPSQAKEALAQAARAKAVKAGRRKSKASNSNSADSPSAARKASSVSAKNS